MAQKTIRVKEYTVRAHERTIRTRVFKLICSHCNEACERETFATTCPKYGDQCHGVKSKCHRFEAKETDLERPTGQKAANEVTRWEDEQIPIDTIPTKELTQQLGLYKDRISRLKNRFNEQFLEGVHYYRNKYGHLFWTAEGVEKLRQIIKEQGITK